MLGFALLLLPSCDKLKELLPKQPPVQAGPVAETAVPDEVLAAKPVEPAELFGPEKPVELEDEGAAVRAEQELNRLHPALS